MSSRTGPAAVVDLDLDDLPAVLRVAAAGAEHAAYSFYEYQYACRCGGKVVFTDHDLRSEEVSVTFCCPNCSLAFAVHYVLEPGAR